MQQVGPVLQLLWEPRIARPRVRRRRGARPRAIARLPGPSEERVSALARGLWFVSVAHTAHDVERRLSPPTAPAMSQGDDA